MVGIKEADILKAVKNRLDWYERLGVVAYFDRLPAGKIQINGRWLQLGRNGISDLFALVKTDDATIILFIETKTEIGRQSEDQKAFEQRVKYLKNVYYKIIRHPKELDQLIELLTGHSQKQLDAIEFNNMGM